MVDDQRAEARLARLEETIERLDEVRAGGRDVYLADANLRAMTERLLEVAIQICIDLGAQIVAELSAPAPTDYAGIFKILADKELLPADLAGRLGDAARQRNLLVHLYMEVDDSAVFGSLMYLDDLRQFAAFAERRID
ncbi:MAG TPA: DUF86 domain-containing protein [Solirubrobacterales bacterium]